ncbi:MAG: HDOD domain-containing protein [Desulfuromonadales bacterium]|nr:HDOD domain-containing protein [Desulfuromonadales bacterium]
MAGKPLPLLIDENLHCGQLPLPVHPDIARGIASLACLEQPDATVLGNLAGHDPVLACTLFRAANSAFYQGLPKVVTIAEAITRIGAASALRELDCAGSSGVACHQGRLRPDYLLPLWRHSLGCALGARWLANRCGYQAIADQAHLAGLLHDTGKLFLLAALEQIAGSGEAGIMLGSQLIEEVLESMHVEMGMRMATAWNLPDDIAGVVGRHHEVELDSQELVLALVKLANKGCRKVGLGWQTDPGLVLPTTAEAQFLGIDEIALAEYEIMLEDRFGLVAAGEFLTNSIMGFNV